MSKFVTEKMTVTFAYLNKPDDKFGADAANFNITVPLESDLSPVLIPRTTQLMSPLLVEMLFVCF